MTLQFVLQRNYQTLPQLNVQNQICRMLYAESQNVSSVEIKLSKSNSLIDFHPPVFPNTLSTTTSS